MTESTRASYPISQQSCYLLSTDSMKYRVYGTVSYLHAGEVCRTHPRGREVGAWVKATADACHVEDSNRPGWRWSFYFCSDGDEGRVAWGRQIRMDGRIPPPRRLPPPPKMPVAATPKAIIIAASALPASAARRCLSLLPSLPTSASAKRYSTVME